VTTQRTEKVFITPSMAKTMLEKLAHAKRKPDPGKVKKFAAKLRNREWIEGGPDIKFCENGTMVDGQHRLLAIISTGTTWPMNVTTGIPMSKAEEIIE